MILLIDQKDDKIVIVDAANKAVVLQAFTPDEAERFASAMLKRVPSIREIAQKIRRQTIAKEKAELEARLAAVNGEMKQLG